MSDESKMDKTIRENRENAIDKMEWNVPSIEQVANEAVAKQERANLLNQVNFLNFAENARPVDLQKVYCSRTGKPLGSLNEEIYKRYIQMQGLALAEKNLSYLQNAVSTMADPCWLHTDGDSLKFLAQNDPIGYYVYAAAKAVQYHRTGYNKEKALWLDATLQNKFMIEKIHLWEDLQSVSITDIMKANAIWQQFHATMHTKFAKFTYIHLDYYGRKDIVASMADKLSEIMRNAIKAKNQYEMLERRRRFDLASMIKSGMGGASNYQMQGKIGNRTSIDQIVDILEAIGFDQPTDDSLDFLDFPEIVGAYGIDTDTKSTRQRYSGKIFTHEEKPRALLNVKTGQVETTKVVSVNHESFLDKLRKMSENKPKPTAGFLSVFNKK